MKCDDEPGPDGCHDLMVERIRYFTGRHMTARDFRDGDAYHRSFRHLHNRVLHGSGIACGLDVERHWREDCRRDRVIVRCGLAIDCCGREIVVARDLVTAPIPWDRRPEATDQKTQDDKDTVLILCLKYRETLTEKVPVLYSPVACSNPSLEDGRIREGYELCWKWIRRGELRKYGWDDPLGCAPPDESADRVPRGQKDSSPIDPCDEEEGRPRCCLTPACPDDHCVPLAVIRATRPEEMDAPDAIDTTGQRSLAPGRQQLTHICWLSWEHGGVVKVGDLRSLKVRFDRPLLEPEFPGRPGPRGINERTFVVQYGEQLEDIQTEDIDFVEYERPPYLTDGRRTAVYEVRKPRSYLNHVIHVTLKCDFILDCRRNPVDGNFLGGYLSTGNGVPGGTFESWFRVVDDYKYDRIVEQDEATRNAARQEQQS
jgi:hypothetical protein